MFPFNLTGPSFLLFYALLSAAVLAGYWHYACRRGALPGVPALSELTSDPYQIAYLRADAEETMQLAVVNLVDRGLLTCTGSLLQVSGKTDPESMKRPLDRAILELCAAATTPSTIFRDPRVRAACNTYGAQLRSKGLLRSDTERSQALIGVIAVFAILGGIAIARIIQALSHGRHNILFLIALTLLACWLAQRIYASDRTALGRQMLSGLRILMARLKARSNRLVTGGVTNEALLFASVFGVDALPAGGFPFVHRLFPKTRSSGGNGGSGDGGGDGGGCGSSCGGGCGGCGGG